MLKTVSDAVLGFVETKFGKLDIHEVGTALLYTVYVNMRKTYGSKKAKEMITTAVKKWAEFDELYVSYPFLSKPVNGVN